MSSNGRACCMYFLGYRRPRRSRADNGDEDGLRCLLFSQALLYLTYLNAPDSTDHASYPLAFPSPPPIKPRGGVRLG